MGSCTSKPVDDEPPSPDASSPVPLPPISPDMRYVRPGPGPSHSHDPSFAAAQAGLPDPGTSAPVQGKKPGNGNGTVGRSAGEDVKGKQPMRPEQREGRKLDLGEVQEQISLKTRRVLEAGRGKGLVNEHGMMEAKILLLGSGESGKSTILKQMKILHGGGFTPAELVQYKQIVRHNLVDSAQALLRVVLQWGYRPDLGELPPNAGAEDDPGYASEQQLWEQNIMENLPGTHDFSVPIRLPDEEDEGAASGAGGKKRARAATRDSTQAPDQPLSFADMMNVDAQQYGREWARDARSVSSKKSKKRAAAEADKGPAGGFQLGYSPAVPPVPGQQRQDYDPRAARSALSVSQTSTISDFGYPASSPTTSAFQIDYERGAPVPRAHGSQPTIMTTGTGPGSADTVRALLDFQLQEGKNIPQWVAQAIILLWSGQSFMHEILKRSSEFYLMDNAPYFFKNTLRICDRNYWPTNQDVLRSRVQTRGVTESRFVADRMHIHMYDVGGQRAERKKWIYAFEKVKCVIFTVALSEYDQTLLENPDQNRMQESIKLFENIIASRWFQNASFVIFFNKMDVFEEKYKRSPLKTHFAEYSGNDVESGLKFIVWKYRQANKAGVRAYSHVTTATDTKRIEVVLAGVRENILDNAIKDSGLI
ncbi:G-alpha-domain-containing protein [Calocera viscosa TUFC12733]|uniref:G-alpha-domain-containing protein n=1 Tax=Calocera viscosa (strain TUFC12733) TaxID=1330018 RepID=A0A167I5F4_CALVF|nr:G-alpha-domain-containing protein [Calocera viscosa TUFC12733]